jgi:endonuclease/exonuclease/phosphatase (EEP) superfamily protein YafD
MRSFPYLGTIGLIIGLSVLYCVFCLFQGNAPLAVMASVIALFGIGLMTIAPLAQINQARKVAATLAEQQEPFWLIAGNVALWNLSVTPPPGARAPRCHHGTILT